MVQLVQGKPVTTDVQILQAGEDVSRPFASCDRIPADRAEMIAMVRDLCLVLDGAEISNFDPNGGGWSKRVILTATGLQHPSRPAALVGFFGHRRPGTTAELLAEIDAANDQLIGRFTQFPSIRGYVSRVLGDETNYANLVVMDDEPSIGQWRRQNPHPRAAGDLSEAFYSHVRIYNGTLEHGITEPDRVSLTVAKYWDYRVSPPWRAQRRLDTD